METRILHCPGCGPHAQDRIYGPRLRVHNAITNTKSPTNWRCTVCGREQA